MIRLGPLKRVSVSCRREDFLSLTLAYMLCIQGISAGVNSVLNFIGFRTALDTAVIYVSLLGTVGISIFTVSGRKKIHIDELWLFFLLGSFALACCNSEVNAKYLNLDLLDYAGNSIYVLFLYAVPAYLLMRRIQDYRALHHYLLMFSYATVIMSLMTYFVIKDAFAESYMTLSYNMLLQTVVLLLHKPRRYKLVHYTIAVLGCYVIFMGGARGAFLGLLVVAVLMIVVAPYSMRKKAVLLITMFSAMILVLMFYESILLAVINWMEKSGIESRTFKLLFMNGGGEIADSGRGKLYGKALQSITILGKGLFADRVVLDGIYVHNLFIELLVEYGYVIGGGLCLIVAGLIINAVFKTKSPEWRLIVMLIPNGFVMLMLSNSYLLQNPCFYALMGACMNVCIRKRQKTGRRGMKRAEGACS